MSATVPKYPAPEMSEGLLTHLSTLEIIAAVPVPNTSNNDPSFSASTRSFIINFLSLIFKLAGNPGMTVLPEACSRATSSTLMYQPTTFENCKSKTLTYLS